MEFILDSSEVIVKWMTDWAVFLIPSELITDVSWMTGLIGGMDISKVAALEALSSYEP